jgi:hypothetical protein
MQRPTAIGRCYLFGVFAATACGGIHALAASARTCDSILSVINMNPQINQRTTMKNSISKDQASETADVLHKHLLEMHREMVILAAHGTHADPNRVGLQLETLIESGTAVLLSFFGTAAEFSDDFGFFQDPTDSDEHDDSELN